MSGNRKKYSAIEKAKVVLEAIKGNITMAEIISNYSVHPTQVNKWKKQVIEQLPEIFSNIYHCGNVYLIVAFTHISNFVIIALSAIILIYLF